MRLTLITIAGDRTRLLVVSVLQALWQELGIQVEIRPESARMLFPDTLQKQNLQPGGVAVWRWVIQPEATVSAHGLWLPRGTNLDQLTEGSPWDAVQENKDLIRQALGTIDDEERYGLLRRQQEIWARELPTLPLYWHVRVVSMDRRLTGYVPLPDQYLGWGVENWNLGAATSLSPSYDLAFERNRADASSRPAGVRPHPPAQNRAKGPTPLRSKEPERPAAELRIPPTLERGRQGCRPSAELRRTTTSPRHRMTTISSPKP